MFNACCDNTDLTFFISISGHRNGARSQPQLQPIVQDPYAVHRLRKYLIKEELKNFRGNSARNLS